MKKKSIGNTVVMILTVLIALTLQSFVNIDTKLVTLHVKNASVEQILWKLHELTKIEFVYSDPDLAPYGNISVNVTNTPLKKVLDQIFKETDLNYEVRNDVVVISKRSGIVKSGQQSAGKERKFTVSGIITDQNGEPLPGVSVFMKDATTGVVYADMDGKYSIDVEDPANAWLTFSFVGMKPQDIRVGGKARMNVVMENEAELLDEVMVVAYGTAKKGTFTGSAAVVSSNTLKDRPVTEVSQMLTGTTAGVQVGTSNGQPGSAPTIRIRGLGSFNASNSPLIVLDGMPYDNAFSSINPNDIESITILKDASSAALYGARAANGVLLVNTKKGVAGKMNIGVRYNLGLTTRQSKDYKTMGLTDYMETYWEANRNSWLYSGMSPEEANVKAGPSLIAGMSYNAFNMRPEEVFSLDGKLNPNAKLLWEDDLDWVKAVERVGIRHEASVNISGATDKSDYYASVGYTKDDGYIIGSTFKRYTAKTNVNSSLTKWFKTGINLTAALTEAGGNQNESSGNNSNPFRFTRNVGNIYPIHLHHPDTGEYILNANGEKMYDFGLGYTTPDGVVVPKRDFVSGNNPAIELQNIYDGYTRNTINAKIYGEITFLKNFRFSATGGVAANAYNGYSGSYVYAEKKNSGTSTKSSSTTTTWTFNQILTYTKDIGKHHIDLMAGHESYDYKYTYFSSSMKTQIQTGSNFEFRNFAEVNGMPTSYINTYAVEGYLSRANYDYNNTYFLSASYRRDASSRFYKDARWGNFWSVGGGWRIEQEKFMRNIHWINLLKLRASYGVVGNDDLNSYYPWQAVYTTNHNGVEPGYVQSSLGNRNLSWEISKNLDIALEFTLFKSRLNGTVEYFNRRSSNLLFAINLPLSSGVDSQDVNAGAMYNKGVEITLDGSICKTKEFTWSLNANATFLKNRITELPMEPYISNIYKIEPGHSRYDLWLRQWYGVNPETGYNLFVADIDNPKYVWGKDELIEIDGVKYTETIEHAKYDWYGSTIPKVTGGFGTSLQYKNWSLSINCYYQLGGKFYDSTYRSFMEPGSASLSYSKLHSDLKDRWRQPGDITSVPKVSLGTDATNISAGASTRWITSSNMLEVTNINLSYDLPKSVTHALNITNCKLYFAANNPFLISKRRGMFPRRNMFSGYDGNSDIYLPSRTFSFGINLSF